METARRKKCLIVYHYFAHYRLHLMRDLMAHAEWDFEMISDSQTADGIKGIDPALAEVAIDEGGLSWSFVKNCLVLGHRFPFLWQKGLVKRLREDDYDAVIFLGSIYFISTWVGMFKARRIGKQVLFWTHGFLGKDGGLLSRFRHAFYRQADCCLLYGERAKKIMQDSGLYRPEQLKVIYNSLDYSPMNRCRDAMTSESRTALRQELFSDPLFPIVVAVGRVNRAKRFDLLLPALAMLQEEEIPFNCLIIGDGPELQSIKEAASAFSLESRICFYGAAYGDEVDQLLLASDLCVIPGDVGLSAMHAMSAGLPVISHDAFDRQMPEHEAIEEGKTGSFYLHDSVDDLAQKIEWWLSSSERLSAARFCCIEHVSGRFNSTYQVSQICEALETLEDD